MNALLVAQFSEEEISIAAHQLGSLKSPGPDGFPSFFFYLKYWQEVKDIDTQNAFVQGRQIQDNIVVAHEVYHYLRLKRKGSKFEASLKMDMSKAYDRVEWDFLRAIMAKMGFSNFWIHLVMTCISSVSFSVLLNGKPGAPFSTSRGLRQGDPLSPYLF
ncbi:hypothetical protein L3X38_037624 [Prunus dulcis]|uniref:Reverse transcriptase domain-containing protein n=1 Tax=Prunus dulcis TaxID=3755 RepID=A0AAD4YPQ6_PRUDU|nr:hypothetical protein L3X38_037624 [Prunus dulcis]